MQHKFLFCLKIHLQEPEEMMNPLDMALTNVIENIIKVDDTFEDVKDGIFPNLQDDLQCTQISNDFPEPKPENPEHSTFSVFSIGPITSALPEKIQREPSPSFFGCLTVDNLETEDDSEKISASSDVSESVKSEPSVEENLDARAARLKRLEEQADWLVRKMSATNRRGSALNSRLEELHEIYGAVPEPPAMPDVLPNFKLPTTDSSKNV